MSARTALITGISGQDGSYMAELLRDKGYRVVGIARDLARARERLSPAYRDAVELLDIDLTSGTAIETTIDAVEPNEIYNFAGFSTGSGMYDAPIAMGDLNGLTVVRFLEAIKSHGGDIRFCQASSSEMFGLANVSPQDESTQFLPRSPYAAAKLFAHNMIGISRQQSGTFACSAILFNHESPRRSTKFVSRKITHTVAAIRSGLASDLSLGDLDARRDWGHAEDVVRAMWLMLQSEGADDYAIATGTTHSVADLCEIAFAHVGLDWTKYVRVDPSLRRAPSGAQIVGDTSRARERLGWTPRISFEDMIKGMVDADLERIALDRKQEEHTA